MAGTDHDEMVARGNVTDTSLKYRNVCFTLNNPTETGTAFLARIVKELPVSYVIFQRELAPGTGTPHFQGYLELSRQVRAKTVHSALNKAHCEPRKGTPEQAANYCKDRTKSLAPGDSGPWEHGSLSKQGKRNDVRHAVQLASEGGIAKLIQEFPEGYVKYRSGINDYLSHQHRTTERKPLKVTLCIGPTGTGKTHKAWNSAGGRPIKIPGSLQWFDNYSGDPKVLFDEFDGARSKTELGMLLNCLDKYPLRLPIKGSHTFADWEEVWITTNFHIRDWYDWTKREAQYRALLRRIDRVYLWWVELDYGRFVCFDRGSDLFETWSKGPPEVIPPTLGPMDDWVEHADPPNYFKWFEVPEDMVGKDPLTEVVARDAAEDPEEVEDEAQEPEKPAPMAEWSAEDHARYAADEMF